MLGTWTILRRFLPLPKGPAGSRWYIGAGQVSKPCLFQTDDALRYPTPPQHQFGISCPVWLQTAPAGGTVKHHEGCNQGFDKSACGTCHQASPPFTRMYALRCAAEHKAIVPPPLTVGNRNVCALIDGRFMDRKKPGMEPGWGYSRSYSY